MIIFRKKKDVTMIAIIFRKIFWEDVVGWLVMIEEREPRSTATKVGR